MFRSLLLVPLLAVSAAAQPPGTPFGLSQRWHPVRKAFDISNRPLPRRGMPFDGYCWMRSADASIPSELSIPLGTEAWQDQLELTREQRARIEEAAAKVVRLCVDAHHSRVEVDLFDLKSATEQVIDKEVSTWRPAQRRRLSQLKLQLQMLQGLQPLYVEHLGVAKPLLGSLRLSPLQIEQLKDPTAASADLRQFGLDVTPVIDKELDRLLAQVLTDQQRAELIGIVGPRFPVEARAGGLGIKPPCFLIPAQLPPHFINGAEVQAAANDLRLQLPDAAIREVGRLADEGLRQLRLVASLPADVQELARDSAFADNERACRKLLGGEIADRTIQLRHQVLVMRADFLKHSTQLRAVVVRYQVGAPVEQWARVSRPYSKFCRARAMRAWKDIQMKRLAQILRPKQMALYREAFGEPFLPLAK